MPSLLLLTTAFILVQTAAPCTLTTSLPDSHTLPLNNGRATLSLPLTLCTDVQTTPLLVLSSLPPTLSPSLTLSSIQNHSCNRFTATLAFSSGPAIANLTLTHLSCSLTIHITITGLTAILLPSRTLLSDPSAAPLTLNPPRSTFSPTNTYPIALSILLPSGNLLYGRRAARAIQARIIPPIPGLVASLGAPGVQGNFLLSAEFDGSHQPRERLQSRIELTAASGATAQVHLDVSDVRPVVHQVRGSRLQPSSGGGVISLVVSRGAGVRRLVLKTANKRLEVPENQYAWERGFIVASFKFPQVYREMIGRVGWTLQVLVEEKVWEARDSTSFELYFGWKPILSVVFPRILVSGSRGMLTLHGEFIQESVKGVRIGDKELSNEKLFHVGENEIRLRVPPLRKKETGVEVLVVVLDMSGLESDGIALEFDPFALDLDVDVLGASHNAEKGYSEVTSVCGGASPIVQVNLDESRMLFQDLTFRFSIRTSEMEGTGFTEIGSGSNNAIRLDLAMGTFREDSEFADEVVTVLVTASVDGQAGEAVVFISRWLRRDRIGVIISSLGNEHAEYASYPGQGFEAYVYPFQICGGVRDLEISTQWRVNGELVEKQGEFLMNKGFMEEGNGVRLGLGNRLLLPNTTPTIYQFSVRAQQRSSGKLFALGIHSGISNGDASDEDPIHAVINGGAEHVSAPVDKTLSFRCDVFNEDNASLMYQWTCVDSSKENLDCDEVVFPAELKDDITNISQFSVSPGAGVVGKTIEYSVQVSTPLRESQVVSIHISFVAKGNVMFPTAIIQTGTAPSPTKSNSSTHIFQSFDDVVLQIEDPLHLPLDFVLQRRKNESDWDDIELKENGNILISHNGYWSPRSRREPFFGLHGNALQPGLYRLHGTVEADGISGGTSWRFTKAAAAAVILFEPPVRVGTANETTFHASTVSVPHSDNQFFFSLRAIDEDEGWNQEEEARLIPENCLGTCNGHGKVSFTVRAEGRYLIVVDMFDSTGTRHIASNKTTSYIVVQAPQVQAKRSNGTIEFKRQLDAAIKRGDEGEFLDMVSKITTERPLTGILLRQSLSGLREISTSPFRNPVQIARILHACTSVMNHNAVDMRAASQLMSIAESAIAQIPTSAPYGSVIARDVARFYGAVSDKASLLDAQASSDGGNGGWEKMEIGQHAFRNIILVLSSGLECGAIRRVSVPRKSRPEQSGMGREEYYDDYRVGIRCFDGQIRSLSPEPFLSRLCAAEPGGRVEELGNVSIMASVERHEMVAATESGDTVRGPVVSTSFVRREGNGRVTAVKMESGGKVKGICVETRVSVFVNQSRIRNKRLFEEGGELRCANAGKVLMSDSSMGGGERREEMVSDFGLHADGRVSSVVETRIAASVQMEVNMTLLEMCAEHGRISGVGGSKLGVILSVVGGVLVGGILCVAIVGYTTSCFHKFENFSVPEDAAPGHSFSVSGDLSQSTSGSLGMNGGGILLAVKDEWEDEYVRLSGTEENLSSGDGGSIQQARSGHGMLRDRLESVEGDMDDYASRGGLSSFRRTSLSEARTGIGWHGLGELDSDSIETASLSGRLSEQVDCYAPDIYVRGVILEDQDEDDK